MPLVTICDFQLSFLFLRGFTDFAYLVEVFLKYSSTN
jgi:hypothetical protein